MAYRSITELVHEALRTTVRPGALVLDATAGNGHDTLFLAACVGPGGRVFALDCQAAAIAATRERLATAGFSGRVELIEGDHAELRRRLPASAHGRLAAAVFNLGYLPGGDKAITTRTDSTLAALEAALDLLRPAGLLLVVCYPGHPEGAREAAAVTAWAEQRAGAQPAPLTLERIDPGPTRRPAPFLCKIVTAAAPDGDRPAGG